jgi:hypothetical protein
MSILELASEITRDSFVGDGAGFFFLFLFFKKIINFPEACTCQPNWLKLQPKIPAWTALVFSPTPDIDLVCPTSIDGHFSNHQD